MKKSMLLILLVTISVLACRKPTMLAQTKLAAKSQLATLASFEGFSITTKNITLVDGTTEPTNVLNGVTRTASLSVYRGSLAGSVGTSHPYFTTYKNPQTGVWSLVDPAGFLFYLVGVNSVQRGGSTDPVVLLRGVSVNTIGNFSDETINTMPYTSRLNMGYKYRSVGTRERSLWDNGIMAVFDSRFVVFCDSLANAYIPTSYLTDKNLLGYFSDNEVPLANPCCGKERFIARWLNVSYYGGQAIADTDPNYQAAANWMKSRHGGVLTTPDSADIAEWPGVVPERYYQVCRNEIKKGQDMS